MYICTKIRLHYAVKLNPAVQCLLLCDILLSMLCISHQVKIQQILKLIASILTVKNNIWNKFTKCWFAKKCFEVTNLLACVFQDVETKLVTYFV